MVVFYIVFQSPTAVIYQVVVEVGNDCCLEPDATAFHSGAAPSAVDHRIVVAVEDGLHVGEALVAELETVGVGIVDEVERHVNEAVGLVVYGFAAIVAVADEAVVHHYRFASGDVDAVLGHVAERAAGDDELAVRVAEVEARHALARLSLEELMLERERAFLRLRTAVFDDSVLKDNLLGVIATDDAAPVAREPVGLRGFLNGECHGIGFSAKYIEVAKNHNFRLNLGV